MFKPDDGKIEKAYEYAKEVYAGYGIDTDAVLKKMNNIHISLHCWQGDDVGGFEVNKKGLSGGILATGNWPGRARNSDELRQDLDKALSLIPGKHRVNLHAIYAETDGKFVDRDKITPKYFMKWIDWAKQNNLGIDFNPTFFSHDMAASGYTLSSKDKSIRKFWIEHGKRCREIANQIGRELNSPCINNIWIPDGSKDLPANRIDNRKILKDSLDEIFSIKYDRKNILDSVESKLFGIGSESYVVGSHEFYMGYALKNNIMLCLDMGHFHPTEVVADKISSILTFMDELLIHVSRGVRWDSDHVAILNDDLQLLADEISRCNAYNRVHIALDYFDASINRITAWTVGARATLKAILISLLEPINLIKEQDDRGDRGNMLALKEEFKTLPYAAVWDKYCLVKNVPVGGSWLDDIKVYEDDVLVKRH
ncbi:MAG TPA: L-rhamnose isomerase [Clostridiaceae bacterium]|nr:L-rhamnose isomerase [Clostridiaceae bacterium]